MSIPCARADCGHGWACHGENGCIECRCLRFATTPQSAQTVSDAEVRVWAEHTCNLDPETAALVRFGLWPQGARIEDLILDITDMGGRAVRIAVDQWWGIRVEGRVLNLADADYDTGWEFKTYIQADDMDLGLLKTFQVWAERYAQCNGEVWDPIWERRARAVDQS